MVIIQGKDKLIKNIVKKGVQAKLKTLEFWKLIRVARGKSPCETAGTITEWKTRHETDNKVGMVLLPKIFF